MEGKKISFGFKKTKKAEKPVVEEKKDYIECVEEQSIKVLGGEEIEKKALVIPLKPNTLITSERLQKIAEEVEGNNQDAEIKDVQENTREVQKNETLDQMAERELLEAATLSNKQKPSEKITVPLPREPPLDGQKESTLDDYENVPIREFGIAMLRGMGWKPDKDQTKYKEPQLRPKGLGLGADKVIKQNPKPGKDEEELMVVKNAFVKITTGKYSGYYGKVLSLDEDNGRVLVDVTVNKESVSLSEFMLHAVTKAEFDRESRVINADKFDEYKRKEDNPQKSRRNQSPSAKARGKSPSSKQQDEKASDATSRRRNDSPEDSRIRERKYSSNDSLSSSDDGRRRRGQTTSSDDSRSRRKHHKKHKKSTPKRDIDKKRKGKKKKRDRDRSPHQKKHRK